MELCPEMTCMLSLDVQSSGWEKDLMKMLKKIRGISSFNVDATQGTSVITGRIHLEDLTRMISKSSKRVQLSWLQYKGGGYQQQCFSPHNHKRGYYNGGHHWNGHKSRAPNHYNVAHPGLYSNCYQFPQATPANYHYPVPTHHGFP